MKVSWEVKANNKVEGGPSAEQCIAMVKVVLVLDVVRGGGHGTGS